MTPPPPDAPLQHGLIVKTQSGFFTVHTQNLDGTTNEIVCQLRGRLKRTQTDSTLLALGDTVHFQPLPDGTGIIETIDERETSLVRRSPSPRKRLFAARGLGHLERDKGTVIVANPDQAVIVFACAEPTPHLRMLDRFLVVAESNRIPAVICINKIDLIGEEAARDLFGLYSQIGYPLIYTSATTGQGIDTLRNQLTGKLSALAGPSGVGKSSLLNRIQPDLGLAISATSDATGKGRHTTVHRQLHRLEQGGWVADTPGIRALAIYDTEPEEIDGYFVEIAPLVAHCEFSSCTHTEEPGCAVLDALETGKLQHSRYDSYLRLRQGIYD